MVSASAQIISTLILPYNVRIKKKENKNVLRRSRKDRLSQFNLYIIFFSAMGTERMTVTLIQQYPINLLGKKKSKFSLVLLKLFPEEFI